MAVFEDCQATKLTTQPPRLVLSTDYCIANQHPNGSKCRSQNLNEMKWKKLKWWNNMISQQKEHSNGQKRSLADIVLIVLGIISKLGSFNCKTALASNTLAKHMSKLWSTKLDIKLSLIWSIILVRWYLISSWLLVGICRWLLGSYFPHCM